MGFVVARRYKVLLGLAGVLVLVVVLLVGYLEIMLRRGEVSAEQLAEWNRELPADEAFAVSTTATTSTQSVLTIDDVKKAPATSELPTSLTQTADFWGWMSDRYPEAAADPRLAAWRGLAARADWDSKQFADRFRSMRSQFQGEQLKEYLDGLREECGTYLAEKGAQLSHLDAMLSGGPLPWPPAEETMAIKSKDFGFSYISDNPPDLAGARQRALNLAVADALAGGGEGGEGRRAARIVLIDRRFTTEADLPAFRSLGTEISLFGEMVGEQGRSLVPLETISPAEAAEFLKIVPEPILDSGARRRRMLRLMFAQDRLTRADRTLGYFDYVADIQDFNFLTPNPNLAGEFFQMILFPLRDAELRLHYASRRRQHLESLMEFQKDLDEALEKGPEAVKALRKVDGFRENNYRFYAREIFEIPSHNDVRLMLHAVMIARAAQPDAGAVGRRLEAFSAWHAAGRLAAEQTSAGWRLSLGERIVLVPELEPGRN